MTKDKKLLKFLIDTGANKNFIKPELAPNAIPVQKQFIVQSAGGNSHITKKVVVKFFECVGNKTKTEFFVLPGLESFDGIIGDDTLKEIEAVIDRKNHLMTIFPGIKLPLKKKKSVQVNNISIRDQHLEEKTRNKLQNLTKKFEELFGPLNNQGIDTSIEAEIKTTTDDPIYSKIYPYPVQMRAEVDSQISKLLEDG